jgi:hypothetical protein
MQYKGIGTFKERLLFHRCCDEITHNGGIPGILGVVGEELLIVHWHSYRVSQWHDVMHVFSLTFYFCLE